MRTFKFSKIHKQLKFFLILSFNVIIFATPIISIAGKITSNQQQVKVYKPQQSQNPLFNQMQPKIQLAILLDTSGSMSGLINQTREQLWQIVNEFSKAKRHGVAPRLEVAVYEYGNDGLSRQSGFIRQVAALTEELDEVSESLFALTTNGGNEYCGYAIKTAVEELQWSQSSNDIKAIFIAGNEPFTQGPVSFHNAIEKAKNRGIVVNTIHAGNFVTGQNTGWKDGAVLAGGSYLNIDHNHQVAHINAPQDKKIARLNLKLNETYVPYGKSGKRKAKRQFEQDAKTQAVAPALLSKRARSKASSLYRNSSWDLVDAMENGKVDLDKVEEEALPEAMKPMAPKEKQEYIQAKSAERKKIKKEIDQLSKQREAYVAEQRRNAPKPEVNTMNEAVVKAIHDQGKNKQYSFE